MEYSVLTYHSIGAPRGEAQVAHATFISMAEECFFI